MFVCEEECCEKASPEGTHYFRETGKITPNDPTQTDTQCVMVLTAAHCSEQAIWNVCVFSMQTQRKAERDVPSLTQGKPDKVPRAKPGLIDRSVTQGREVDSYITADLETPRLQKMSSTEY